MGEVTGQHSTIAVLGAGDMAGAVMRSVLTAPEFTPSDGGGSTSRVRLTTHTSRPAWAVDHPAVTLVTSAEDPEANVQAVADADIVLLGVRPEDVESVATEIAPHLLPGVVVISIAAAPPIEGLERLLPPGTSVMRAMPNLPVDIGEGVIGLAANAATSEAQFSRVAALLKPTGLVLPVEETQMDVFTAVPGVGPAYVSYFIEALVAATVAQGIDEAVATQMIHAVVRGSVARLDATDGDAHAVRKSMMHPNNATDTAMRTLDERGVMDAVGAAVEASMERLKEMARGA